jgi:outer membrane lipoprotein-sorting protein
MNKRLARLVLLQPALILAAGPAQTLAPSLEATDGKLVLERVADIYRGLRTFRSTALIRTTIPRGPANSETMLLTTAFKRPAKSRLQLDRQGETDHVDVQNGDSRWHYMPDRRAYCSPKRVRHWHPWQAPFVLSEGLGFEQIARGLKTAKVLGLVQLNVGARTVKAIVVRATYAPLRTMYSERLELVTPNVYWIEADTGIVLQQSYETRIPAHGSSRSEVYTTTVSVIGYQIDVPIPDRVFNLSVPRGVTETTCLALSGGG